MEVRHITGEGGAWTAPWEGLRIVHISDTHGLHWEMLEEGRIPDGDILIHSGDFMNRKTAVVGEMEEILLDMNAFFGALPHKHKVFVAGNHEYCFVDYGKGIQMPATASVMSAGAKRYKSPEEIGSLLTNCIYLQDSEVTLEGIRIYGTPWNATSSAYALGRMARKRVYGRIPQGIDVLVTHVPMYGIADLAYVNWPILFGFLQRKLLSHQCRVCSKPWHHQYGHSGCDILRDEVLNRVKPKIALFGHVHDDHGAVEVGGTLCVNSAMKSGHDANVIELTLDESAIS